MTETLSTSMVTGLVRLSYAHLFEPASINGSQPKFSVSIIIPKSDKKTIADINAAVEAAKQSGVAKYGGKIPAVLKLPLRDGDAERPDDAAYKNSYFLNASSAQRPGIVDVKRQAILDADAVYSGCYGLVSINCYPFNTNGNKGVAVGLNHVMKIKDGEALSGREDANTAFANVSTDAYVEENDDL